MTVCSPLFFRKLCKFSYSVWKKGGKCWFFAFFVAQYSYHRAYFFVYTTRKNTKYKHMLLICDNFLQILCFAFWKTSKTLVICLGLCYNFKKQNKESIRRCPVAEIVEKAEDPPCRYPPEASPQSPCGSWSEIGRIRSWSSWSCRAYQRGGWEQDPRASRGRFYP